MSAPEAASRDDRVVLLAATSKDGETASSLLQAVGIQVAVCRTVDEAIGEIARGAAVLAMPEEMFAQGGRDQVLDLLDSQPPWSDLPLLVFTRPGADSVMSQDVAQALGNVTLLERPLRTATFLSAVRTAIRARRRQYEIRGYLAERLRAEEALRRADRRKDEFLATLGHELRNPLAPLLTGVHLMRLLNPEDDRVLRLMATMERQIAHLVRLVDDLLEVSRITRGLVEVRHDALDLVDVLREAIDTSRPALDAGRHTLSVDLPDTPLTMRGDPVRLTQVFANLLTNAAKYTNPGGEVSLTVRQHQQRAVVAVRDNGIGIPRAHLAAVFDMFMQVDRSSRNAQGGLGIGLTLVRSLVEMHGGHVEAHSDGVGQGSEFVVELPLTPLAAEPPSATGVTATPSFPKRRILVVDDNRDAAETLAALLEALGATVAVADSGRAALATVEAFAPDVALLDIGMPDMDGYELARRLRGMPARAGTMMIALTGWGQADDVRQSRAAGFDHHMVKPPDLQVLRALLASAG